MDSGVVTFDPTDEETNRTPKNGKTGKMADTRNEKIKENAIWEESSSLDVHEHSRLNEEDTCLWLEERSMKKKTHKFNIAEMEAWSHPGNHELINWSLISLLS